MNTRLGSLDFNIVGNLDFELQGMECGYTEFYKEDSSSNRLELWNDSEKERNFIILAEIKSSDLLQIIAD